MQRIGLWKNDFTLFVSPSASETPTSPIPTASKTYKASTRTKTLAAHHTSVVMSTCSCKATIDRVVFLLEKLLDTLPEPPDVSTFLLYGQWKSAS
jgi:hypothetical protein